MPQCSLLGESDDPGIFFDANHAIQTAYSHFACSIDTLNCPYAQYRGINFISLFFLVAEFARQTTAPMTPALSLVAPFGAESVEKIEKVAHRYEAVRWPTGPSESL